MFRPSDPMEVDCSESRGLEDWGSHDQDAVIDGLNSYLAYFKRPTLPIDGHCFGLSLLWLKKASEGELSWFYCTRDFIVSFVHYDAFDEDKDVEEFLEVVTLGQNAHENFGENGLFIKDIYSDSHYEANFKYKQDKGEMRSITYPYIKLDDLTKYLKKRRNVVQICLSNEEHGVALLIVRGKYVFFDSNYEYINHKVFDDADQVLKEFKYCLYQEFGLQVPKSIQFRMHQLRNLKQSADLNIDLSCIDEPSEMPESHTALLLASSQAFFQQPVTISQDDYFNPCVVI